MCGLLLYIQVPVVLNLCYTICEDSIGFLVHFKVSTINRKQIHSGLTYRTPEAFIQNVKILRLRLAFFLCILYWLR